MIIDKNLRFKEWSDPMGFDFGPLREHGYTFNKWNYDYISLYNSEKETEVLFFEPGDFHCDDENMYDVAKEVDRTLQEYLSYLQTTQIDVINKLDKNIIEQYENAKLSPHLPDTLKVEKYLDEYNIDYEMTEVDRRKFFALDAVWPERLFKHFDNFKNTSMSVELIYAISKFLVLDMNDENQEKAATHYKRIMSKETLLLGAYYASINDTYTTLRLHHSIMIAKNILDYSFVDILNEIYANNLVESVEYEIIKANRKRLSNAKLLEYLMRYKGITMTSTQYKNIANSASAINHLLEMFYLNESYDYDKLIELLNTKSPSAKQALNVRKDWLTCLLIQKYLNGRLKS